MSLVGRTFPPRRPVPCPEPPHPGTPLPSIVVGMHHEPRIPHSSGRPVHLETAAGTLGDPAGYTSLKDAISKAGILSDMDEPAVAVVADQRRYFLQGVNIVNEIGSREGYRPDELVDFGELRVAISNPAIKAVVDGWTEITADGAK